MNRNINLDVLRGVAILMVLVHHFGKYPAGWVGVDLFFVLSGFLISGLLFSEWQRSGTIDIRRFYIRRAFKIWPVFLLYIGVTEIIGIHFGNPNLSGLLSELCFVQNYFPLSRLWGHLWSLAVEEHFYVILPVLLYALSFSRFRYLPACFAGVATTCLLLRFIAGWRVSAEYRFDIYYYPTHLRIDSLFFGVLLGWLRFLHPDHFARIARSRLLFLPMGMAAATSVLFAMRSPIMHTIGYTVLYVGFGALVTWMIDLRALALLQLIARVGKHSYSIYVCHQLFAYAIPQSWGNLPLYLTVSLGVGMLISHAIELPVLALRNRLFPSMATPIGTGSQIGASQNPALPMPHPQPV